jgi:Domain of unknown function (DUF4157)
VRDVVVGEPSGATKVTKVTATRSTTRAPGRLAATQEVARISSAGFQESAGNLAVEALLRGSAIGPKLSVSQPHDPDEREADRAADAIVGGRAVPTIQRKSVAWESGQSCGTRTNAAIHEKRANGTALSTASVNATRAAAAVISGGRPLPNQIRLMFESALRRDLSAVRVHTDSTSADAARAIGARAFTFGANIAFASGEYGPEHSTGRRLLAHELTHVVQQSGPYGNSDGRIDFPSVQRQVAVSTATHADAVDAADTATSTPPAAPSDIDLGFNALDRSHRLIEAIDQKQVKLVDDPDDKDRILRIKVALRHVDFPPVVAALSGLTGEQVKEVDERYRDFEHRPIHYDLFGLGESGCPTDLTGDQIYQLQALLKGTVASSTSEEDIEAAAQHRREGDAAELHGLLYGSLTAPEVERVMTLMRRPAEEATALMNEYDLNHDLRSDLFRLGLPNAIRAMMLLSGSSIAADAYVIGMARNRITAIDEELKELNPTDPTAKDIAIRLAQSIDPTAAILRRRRIDALNAERKAQAEIIENRVQVAADEAKKEAEAEGKDALDIDMAIRTRASQVLGAESATEAVVGGTSATLIAGVARNDPPEIMAARLRKLDESGDLTTAALTDAFRALRLEAAEEVKRRYPDADRAELEEQERQLSNQWFIHMERTWDAAVVGDGPTFSQVLDRGAQTEVNVKRGLFMASGRLSPADELVLALAGDRKDMDAVKRILRDKNAQQIAGLEEEYRQKTIQPPFFPMGRSLRFDLFGTAPTKAGEENPLVIAPFGGVEYTKPQGKASGTDRLLLEDYMQRPQQEGGMQEVEYIAGRAEREYEYTIDNRGATGWWRDKWGNEARSLLDATIKEVRAKKAEYLELVKSDPKAAQSERAHLIIRDMHFARATIRGDRAAYEKATAELRATFQAIASFVLQAVLTAVLTPFATALFAARLAQAGAMAVRFATWTKNTVVGMASTIAANKTVYGSDYNTDALIRDLKGGLGSAIGAVGAARLAGPVTQRITSRYGETVAREFVAGAETLGGMEVTGILDGEPSITFENYLEQHFLGKVGGAITHGTTKTLGLEPRTGRPRVRREAGEEIGAMQPTEPGGADVDVPSAPTPMRLEETRTPMALETAPSAAPAVTGADAPKPREVNKHVIRRGGPPSGEPPAGAAKVPVTEIVPEPAPEREAPIEPRAPSGEVPPEQPQAVPQAQATGTPVGTVIQAANPRDIPESWKKYQQQIAADPTREVALLYNHDLDQWAIVQGGPGEVPTLAGMQQLGWEVRDTTLARHSHTVGPSGLTAEPSVLPSGRKGDIEMVRRDAPKGEPSAAAHVSAIDVTTARGRDRTFIFYDRRTDTWIVDYPAVGERGGRGRVSFTSMDQYRSWFEGRFGFSPDAPASGGPRAPGSGEVSGEAPDTASSQPVEARPTPTAPAFGNRAQTIADLIQRHGPELHQVIADIGNRLMNAPEVLATQAQFQSQRLQGKGAAEASPLQIEGGAGLLAGAKEISERDIELITAAEPEKKSPEGGAGLLAGQEEISGPDVEPITAAEPEKKTPEKKPQAWLRIGETPPIAEREINRPGSAALVVEKIGTYENIYKVWQGISGSTGLNDAALAKEIRQFIREGQITNEALKTENNAKRLAQISRLIVSVEGGRSPAVLVETPMLLHLVESGKATPQQIFGIEGSERPLSGYSIEGAYRAEAAASASYPVLDPEAIGHEWQELKESRELSKEDKAKRRDEKARRLTGTPQEIWDKLSGEEKKTRIKKIVKSYKDRVRNVAATQTSIRLNAAEVQKRRLQLYEDFIYSRIAATGETFDNVNEFSKFVERELKELLKSTYGVSLPSQPTSADVGEGI